MNNPFGSKYSTLFTLRKRLRFYILLISMSIQVFIIRLSIRASSQIIKNILFAFVDISKVVSSVSSRLYRSAIKSVFYREFSIPIRKNGLRGWLKFNNLIVELWNSREPTFEMSAKKQSVFSLIWLEVLTNNSTYIHGHIQNNNNSSSCIFNATYSVGYRIKWNNSSENILFLFINLSYFT